LFPPNEVNTDALEVSMNGVFSLFGPIGFFRFLIASSAALQ